MLRSVHVRFRRRPRQRVPGRGLYRLALGWLSLLLVLGLLAPWLANDLPFRVQYHGDTLRPMATPDQWYALRDEAGRLRPKQAMGQIDWPRAVGLEARYAPVPYDPQGSNHYLKSPGWTPDLPNLSETETERFRHWLGTDQSGRDVLACLVHGARSSLWLALLAAALAWLLGIVIGTLSGYWGDGSLQVPRGYVPSLLVGLFAAWFYGFQVWPPSPSGWEVGLRVLLALGLLSGVHLLAWRLWRGQPSRPLPLDLLLNRIIEILDSLPGLLVILALASLTQNRDPGTLLLLLALVGWPRIARLIRAELLREKQTAYAESARSLGLPTWRILLRHLLPNVLPQFFFAIAFSAGGFLLLESTLSFLGLVEGSASWGGLLQGVGSTPEAWWVLWPPVIMIASTMMALYTIGQWWQTRLDPRQNLTQPRSHRPD
jgi:peptide/nickel transport system permease protein